MVGSVSIIDVIWDGYFKSFPTEDIIENAVGNSTEFVGIYAAVLFLPRLKNPSNNQVESE